MKRRRDGVSVAIAGAAVATSVLAVGGVFRWTQAVVGLLIAVALVSQVSSRRKLDRVSPLIVLILLAIGLTAMQLVPLPHAVLELLDPTAMKLRTEGAELAGTTPWPSISLEPAATLRALAFFLNLLGIATLCIRIGRSERGRFMVLGGVAITCGVAALVTGLHMMVSAEALYGLYKPVHAAPPVLGPLLNPNHLGCLMAFGATLSVGLVFYEKQAPGWRALWLSVAIGCTLTALASESRGAALSLALGLAVTCGNLIGRRLRDVGANGMRRPFRHLPNVFVVVVGLGLAIYVSAGDVLDQLDRTSTVDLGHDASKFAAWRSSTALVVESPWVGIGRGAVEPALTRVFPASAFHTYSHLENEYVSAVVEWGIPGAFVLALVFAWCVRVASKRWRDGALAAAAIGAISGVLFQSSVDFGIQLLGVAVPATAVASTLFLVPLRETSRHTWLRVQRIAVIAAILTMSAVLLLDCTRSLQEDHDRVVTREATSELALVEIIQRHPLDYFGFGKIAEQMMLTPGPRTIAFLNHALTLHPTHPGLHRLAARLLVATQHVSQAAIEYQLAIGGSIRPHSLLREIVATMPTAEDAATAIPIDTPAVSILTSLAELKREDVAERWLVHVLDQPTHDVDVIDALYDLASARRDWDIALKAANARLAEVHTQTSRLMLAKVAFEKQDFTTVLQTLADVQSWVGRIDERADAWLLTCDVYSQEKRWDDALRCIRQLDVSGLMTNRHAEIKRREGDIEDRRASETKMLQLKAMDASLNVPVEYIRIESGSGSGAGPANPSPIQNPLLNMSPARGD